MEQQGQYTVKLLMCPACGHAAINHGGNWCTQKTKDGDCDCLMTQFEIAMLHAGEWKAEAMAARRYIEAMGEFILGEVTEYAKNIMPQEYSAYLTARVKDNAK